jgi:hypothetical protein
MLKTTTAGSRIGGVRQSCPLSRRGKNWLKKTVISHALIERILRFLHSIILEKKSRVDPRSCRPLLGLFSGKVHTVSIIIKAR